VPWESTEIPISVSAGVAAWEAGDTAETLVARADAALYRAKDAGRNRVIVAGR
jgi:diguanylate cyclase (GGDEF)-like protein